MSRGSGLQNFLRKQEGKEPLGIELTVNKFNLTHYNLDRIFNLLGSGWTDDDALYGLTWNETPYCQELSRLQNPRDTPLSQELRQYLTEVLAHYLPTAEGWIREE